MNALVYILRGGDAGEISGCDRTSLQGAALLRLVLRFRGLVVRPVLRYDPIFYD
jgi:hypothetical protein